MSVRQPLIDDRFVDFLLRDVLDLEELLALPAFREHSSETFALYLDASRRLARELLFPTYRSMDESPAKLESGTLKAHPALHEILPRLVELGVFSATRPAAVGGQQLPLSVATVAHMYLMAANLSAYAVVGLTTGAARLIESFGSEDLRERFMRRMLAGEWTGTMALTEPQAGSSLADVRTSATKISETVYSIRGSKIFLSGGDHDLTENIVHLTLARIDGAPPGIKGLSLFAVPKRREENGALVDNDTLTTGVFHKIGWRGLASIALAFGDEGRCHGWLVGEPHQGIRYMFQMMNEARLMIGANGVATASVAYQEAIEYARTRPQGRRHGERDPLSPQVPIIEHADVRRMLLRQKAIVEGGFHLVVLAARHADVAEHGGDAAERKRAKLLLDLLTPIAKSFPAEWGFEANALAVQVHGGYGYTSEYLPEAWLRDQKLNSIHEGTTGIQGLDLLGRKAVAEGGAALAALSEEIAGAATRARRAGIDAALPDTLERASARMLELTAHLGALGARGDVERMLLHSTDYLSLASIIVVGWCLLVQAAAAKESSAPEDRRNGTLLAAEYWLETELPRAEALIEVCKRGEDSYLRMSPAWF